MSLHRLTVPTYFGGLPAGYDFINDPAANGDPGVPSPADGKKGVAPPPGDQNEGTYFVAFNEPGQAVNVNRPAFALAQNTDLLDDLLRRDLGEPRLTPSVTPGAPVSNFVITGEVYVGLNGAPTDEELSLLVRLQTTSGTPLVVFDGTAFEEVKITSITGAGSGWQTNPTVAVSPDITASTTYQAVYLERVSLATQDQSIMTLGALGDGLFLPVLTAQFLNIASAQFDFTGSKSFNGGTVSFLDQTTFTNAPTFNGGALIASGNLDITLGGLTAAVGNIVATLGSISGASVTATTGEVLATLGVIRAAQGNIVAELGNLFVDAGFALINGNISTISGDFLYSVARTRTTFLNVMNGITSAGTPLGVPASGSVSGSSGGAGRTYAIELPSGAVLTQINVQHTQAGGLQNSFQLWSSVPQASPTTPTAVLEQALAAPAGNVTRTDQLTTFTDQTIDNDPTSPTRKMLFFNVTLATATSLLHSIELVWTDPGPRNN